MIQRFLCEAFQRDEETVAQVPAVQGTDKRANVVDATREAFQCLHFTPKVTPCFVARKSMLSCCCRARPLHLKAFVLEQERDETLKLKPVKCPHVRPVGERMIRGEIFHERFRHAALATRSREVLSE